MKYSSCRVAVALCMLAVLLVVPARSLLAADFTVEADPRAFKPVHLYIAPGDTVRFTKMISHNTVSMEGLIPEGAEHWESKLGENIALRLETPGIYAYVCVPHIGFGMVGLIAVGDITAQDIAAYKETAMTVLEGPYRRLIGKINKLEPTK